MDLRRRRADAQPRRPGPPRMTGRVRVGVGGWTFEPWRGAFYPEGLAQKRELEYASRKLTSIEINGTYYGSQKPESFRKWRDETPDDFVFAVKGPRFATNRRVLAEAGELVDRFFASGVLELGDKLGPVNWQFMATKKFDPDDFAAFLALLPEARSTAAPSATPSRSATRASPCPAFVALARDARRRRRPRRRQRLPADRRRHRALRLRPDHGHRRRRPEPATRPPPSTPGPPAPAPGPTAARRPTSTHRRRPRPPRAAARRLPLRHQRREGAEPRRRDGADRAARLSPSGRRGRREGHADGRPDREDAADVRRV